MRIIDQTSPVPGNAAFDCREVRSAGESADASYAIQVEHVVRVSIDGIPTMSLTCSPDNIAELVLGRLFTEGVVDSAEEVGELLLRAGSTSVSVQLAGKRAQTPAGPRVTDVGTSSTDERALTDVLAKGEGLPPVVPIPWAVEDIFALARVFHADSPMHRRTFGAHSCYLAQGAQVLYCCEDLGRHNALDKVIGCALRDGVDLRKCTVFTSGRLPTDMVLKVVRACIPLVVSKAVPTDLAVQMARDHALTLICSAHPDSFRVLNDPLGVVAGCTKTPQGQAGCTKTPQG